VTNSKLLAAALTLLAIWTLAPAGSATAESPEITGLWYGHGGVAGLGGGTIELSFFESPYGLLVQTRIPALGLIGQILPVVLDEGPTETTITIGIPGLLEMSAVVGDDVLDGWLVLIYYGQPLFGEWYAERFTGEVFLPGPSPGPSCDPLPPLYCVGSAEYCSELVPFVPESGPGYLNYPINGETEEDQYRSYATRDLVQLVKYAAAKVDCKAADWTYGTLEPLGLGDMSEADGSIPGTSIGYPGHPPGTHEYGLDIDTAYFQVYSGDNLLRQVGYHYEGYDDAFHLTEPPYALDAWRTALFIAYLSEHPRLRVVGVDGKVGPILEDAFDHLALEGWITWDLRDSIPLAYEEEDTGLGWFLHHHHHLHASTNPLYDIVSSAKLTPVTLNRQSQGNYVTAFLEPVEGLEAAQIDTETVALSPDGYNLLYAEPGLSEISDYNGNGIADLTVKFDRQALLSLVGNGTVEIAIMGLAEAWFFQVSETIKVLGEKEGAGPKHLPKAPVVRPGGQQHSRQDD
jgi:hypothetical protein